MTNVRNGHFGRQVAGIVLLAAGWGWDSGQFVQPFFGSFFGGFIDIVHIAPALLLAVVSPAFLGAAAVGARATGARNTITGIVILSIVAVGVLTVLGLTNPDPNSVGVHTFEDAMPVFVIVAGSLAWLASLIAASSATAQANTAR